MVPANRLLLVLAGLLPLSLLPVLHPSGGAVLTLVVACLGLLVVLDGLLSVRLLDGIETVEPTLSRLPRLEWGEVSVSFRSARTYRQLRVGMPLPNGFDAEELAPLCTVPKANATWRVEWRVQARDRGQFVLPAFHLGTFSRLGFWEVRKQIPARLEIRVYPNLRAERKAHAALFLPRGGVGSRILRHVGKGREFEKLREYVPGDAFEDIHWKATARRGIPITKTYQIERTQEDYVVIDCSRLSAREIARPRGSSEQETDSAPQEEVLERYLSSALMLGVAAEQQGDTFGVVTFGRQVGRYIPAAGGGNHFGACRETIYNVHSEKGNPDYAGLFTFLRNRLHKRALLLILTSLDDSVLSEQFLQGVDLVCRKHLVVVHPLSAPGVEPLFHDDDSPRSVHEIYKSVEGHLTWERVRMLRQQVVQRGVRWAPLTPGTMTSDLINQYLDIKERQLL